MCVLTVMVLGSIRITKKRKRTRRYPPPYKSEFEYRLHTGPMKRHEYEPKGSGLSYVIEGKTYNPDYVCADDPNILYEAKGYFRTHAEAMKYVHVLRSNPDKVIRFIITDPKKRAYPQVKMTMGDWLTKHGFEWCTEDDVPDEWK